MPRTAAERSATSVLAIRMLTRGAGFGRGGTNSYARAAETTVTQTEARRLALLIIVDETGRSLDVSDEWTLHPETNAPFNRDDYVKVTAQARRFLKRLEAQIARVRK
jgi:hypothetical protein